MMQELMLECAKNFRLGKEAKANDIFSQLMLELENNLARITSLIDMNQFNQILGIMFDAQTRGDYLFLADILEYEISPVLNF